jgi:serine protease Do
MVKIFGAGGLAGLHGYGAGMLFSPEGHIATVWSHVLDSDVVTVVLSDGRRFYGELVGADRDLDLAVLKIPAEGLPYFDLARTAEAGPGARVLAFSNMFKVAAGDEPLTVQRGVVSARTELDARRGRFAAPYRGPVYIVDAVTNNPGSAGGVLTTLDGRLLALLGRELKSQDTQTWLNYAVPISQLAPAMRAIAAGEFRPRSTLAPTAELTERSPLELGIVLVPDVVARTPAYIEEVLSDSQAAQAGLLPDDLIVFVDNELIGSIRTLHEALGRLSPGDDLTLTVRRGPELIAVPLRLPAN